RDRQAAQRLLAGANVVIDSLKPGALATAGIDLERVLAERPELIVCSLPGFADELEMAATPAWEPIIGAVAGLYRGGTIHAHGEPDALFTPLPFASGFAGIVAAASIAAAVVARGRTGRGQRIEVPIHSALFLAIGFGIQRIHGRGGWPSGGLSPLVTTYRCADGRWVQLHCGTPRLLDGFVSTAGLESWWEEGLLDRQRLQQQPELVAELQRRLEALFLEKPAEQWERELSGAGLCCAVCRTVEEWIAHPHAEQSGLVVEVPTRYGPMRQPGRLVQAAGTATAPLRAPEDVDAAAVSWRPAPPTLIPDGAAGVTLRGALDGVRVLDLCLILAGPTCARTLAEFGADVIKIDAPETTIIEPFWLDTNRGKRSIVLDLKTDEGQEVLWKLLATADVVVENFRKGVAERLGVGYAQVSARFPRIVYASMNCYGYEGPFAGWAGWEQLAQATTGMQTRFGGRDAHPKLAPYAVNDYASGLAAALGVLGALHERERTGRGRRVTAALAATAGLLQSLYMFDYPGYERAEIEGPRAMGYSALSRLYRCADDWLYLHCPPADWARLTAIPELAGVLESAGVEPDGGPDSALAAALAARFRLLPVAEWLTRLQDYGIAAAPAVTAASLLSDPRLRAAGLVVTTVGGANGAVDHVGIPHRLSMTPATSGRPTPSLGGDTVEILRDLGYDDLHIARLFGRRVVASYGR
ncbi:MAG TPA: CoA transferase, partial [Dehalococcoidia bacterium]|nr:CoA transferase [Dehalococcoidia bacterium]